MEGVHQLPVFVGHHRGRAEVVRVVVPVLPVWRDPRLLGQETFAADEDVLELAARAAAEVGVI